MNHDNEPSSAAKVRRVQVREYGAMTATWHYSVTVPAELDDEQAHQYAIDAARSGRADCYDCTSGDPLPSESEWGTDLREPWEPAVTSEETR